MNRLEEPLTGNARAINLELILREKTSANLFDGLLMCVGRQSDLDKFRCHFL